MQENRRTRRWPCVACRLVVLTAVQALCASNAHAQTSDSNSIAAQVLFDEGKKLMAQGKLADACPKLQESQRLDPGSGTLLNLATCYERQGKFATAWGKYLEAAALAQAGKQTDRARFARDQASKVAAKLSKLVISVPAGEATSGLEVKRDGILVGQPQWGMGVPVDPGEHRVSATAPNRKPWETSITVPTGAQLATVTVPELAALQSTPSERSRALATSGASRREADANAAPDQDPRPGLGTQKTIALVAGGIGAAALVVDGVFFFRSKAKHDDALPHCDGDGRCDDAGLNLRDQAIAAGDIATISSIIGAVGIAGAAALWITAPSSPHRTLTPQVGVSASGISIRGVW